MPPQHNTPTPRNPATQPCAGVVAVVDDDPGIAQALRSWLDHIPTPVCTFHDGAALIAALQPVPSGWLLREGLGGADSTSDVSVKDGAQPLKAVVMDLNMPGPHGFQLARQLREQAPDLPVVVITAASEDHQRHMGGVPPGVVCLSKPFDLDALEAALFGDTQA